MPNKTTFPYRDTNLRTLRNLMLFIINIMNMIFPGTSCGLYDHSEPNDEEQQALEEYCNEERFKDMKCD